MMPLVAGDGAQHPRNLLNAPEWSIVSLAVCESCPTRYALTILYNGLLVREIDGFGVWIVSQDSRMAVVCMRCLGTLRKYADSAARIADGRHIELSEKLSETYWMN